MPEITPFIALTAGARQHLEMNPLLQQALKAGINKDIWGAEWQGFMGIEPGAGGAPGEILDNAQGRNSSFAVDVSIYRCVDIRGAAIASVPLKIFDQPDPNKRKEVQHEALGVLMATNPYGYVAGPDLLRYSLASRDLHGNFAWQVVFDRGGRLRGPLPREIYWIPPAQTKPVMGRDLKPPQPKIPLAGISVTQNNVQVFIPLTLLRGMAPKAAVYAYTYDPTGSFRGTSKITALRMDLNLRVAGQNSNWWFFNNNQRPDLVITGAFSPTPENVNWLTRIWKSRFGGDHNRGPVFLPQDMKVQPLTVVPKDAEWLGQRQAAREDILAAFGVPPPVYGDLSRATYENIRTAYQNFWQMGMQPDLTQIAAYITQQFLWLWPDAQRNQLICDFDYTAVEALQEDTNAIWERGGVLMDRIRGLVDRRMLLPNQARPILQTLFKMMGLPDQPFAGMVPGGDTFYIRYQEVPIIEASVQAIVDANAARAAITGGETNKPGNGQWTLPDANQIRAPLQSARQPAAAPGPSAALPPAAPSPPSKQLALPAPVEDRLTRRLKRHFQDQQTAALRALRAAQDWRDAVEVSRESAIDILREGADLAGFDVDEDELERHADDLVAMTTLEIAHALAPDDSPAERVYKMRSIFREAIEQRAPEVARDWARELQKEMVVA